MSDAPTPSGSVSPPPKSPSPPSPGPTPAPTPTKKDNPTFTEREEALLKVAWLCLKSGPPDVDMEKLKEMGGFNTVKTCSNTWGGIKKKLLAMAPEGTELTATPKKTPATKKAPAKKRAAADAGDDDEESASPTKKAKKAPAKKTPAKKSKAKVKVEEEDAAADGDEE